MSHIGVNLTEAHVWPVMKGPLGECNEALADRENVTLFLKQLEEEATAGEALRDAAADVGLSTADVGCLGDNYLDGGFWPDFPDYATELRDAAIDGMHRALDNDKRLVSVVTQLPGLPRPWVKVIELYSEVVIQSFLPANPIDPT